MVKRDQRLRTPAEFRRVRDAAPRAWAQHLLVLYVAPNDLGHVRVGVTVSGRVGNAVVRNRIRRRLREALRARLGALLPGNDVLVIARPPSASAGWPELCRVLDRELGRAGATLSTSTDFDADGRPNP